jgi:nickel/cobalt transporter (NiCoT) family protein
MKMYRTAISDPEKKIGFNMVVTGLSSFSALFIAAITIAGLLPSAGLTDPITTWLGELDLGHAGLVLIAVFLTVWGIARLTWRRPALG